ncbi:MAG TPA: hypothetical protein DCS30_15125 [Rhizobiales bacterium]|nr:hypothetical protein [Hyphomicrobiales bacterium]
MQTKENLADIGCMNEFFMTINFMNESNFIFLFDFILFFLLLFYFWFFNFIYIYEYLICG